MPAPIEYQLPPSDDDADPDQQTFKLKSRDGKRAETIRLRKDPSDWPLMVIQSYFDMDTDDLTPQQEGELMGVLVDFFSSLIDERDWRAFQRALIRFGVKSKDLLPLVQIIVPAVWGAPTVPPSDSSASSPSGNGRSTGVSPLSAAAVPAT